MATRERQNEAVLVCAAGNGDKEALRLLLTRNWPWLKGLVYGITGDADEVDDVLQDICVRVIEKIGSVRQPERFRPWLAVLARRQALRHRQQRAQRPGQLGGELAELRCDERAARFADGLERTEQCDRILQAVRSLPEKYREVFMLQYSSDLAYRQIAEILDIPVTTVQIRLVRARRMIYDQVVGKDESMVRER
jgi:RNA polymerase sigma-70 factor (ECF subfamily)